MNYNFVLAILLKPFILFVLAACILYPARKAVMRRMRDGRLKRFLLFRVSDASSYRRNPR
jgi:hypothetical protein